MNSYEMSKKFPGWPKEMVSCPGCGQEYGHHKTKVCETCQECSKCCICESKDKKLIEASVFVADLTE